MNVVFFLKKIFGYCRAGVASEWWAHFSGRLPSGNDHTTPLSLRHPLLRRKPRRAATRAPQLVDDDFLLLHSLSLSPTAPPEKTNQKKKKAAREQPRREIWDWVGEREASRRCTTSASRSRTGSLCWPAACWATSAAAAPPPLRGAPAPARSSSSRALSASRPSRSGVTPT